MPPADPTLRPFRLPTLELTRALALFLALAFVRLEVAAALGLPLQEAVAHALFTGLANDLLVAGVVELLAAGAALVRPALGMWVWLGTALFCTLAGVANAVYLKFFGTPLGLWVLQAHLGDVTRTSGSAGHLGASPTLVTGVGLFIAALVVSVRAARKEPVRALWRMGLALALLVAAQGVKSVVRNPRFVPTRSAALASQVLVDWAKEAAAQQGLGNDDPLRPDLGALYQELNAAKIEAPAQQLALYRDLDRTPLTPADPAWPLVRRLPGPTAESRALRARLGLPADGPVHVVNLQVESLRAYEFFHPQLGPQLFPRMHELLAKHGLVFTQAYSSAAEAGLTSRGQFSTACSMLPNVGAPAPAIAFASVRVRCLGQLLQEAGYATTWMKAYHRAYHNADTFESRHGTERFFDVESFRARGVTQDIGSWGMADGPYLLEAAKVLAEVAQEGRPVYTNVLTISTHHPHTVIAEGPLSDELTQATVGHEDYRGYLSRLRYADSAAAAFVEKLFAQFGDRVLIVFSGDHSNAIEPHLPLTHLQRAELPFRIPLAFVTAGQLDPERSETPVHQLDIAPTVAQALGLAGEVTWLGHAVNEGVGTPFVFQAGRALHYRVGERLCHALTPGAAPTCFRVEPGRDPLFDELPETAEDPAQSEFFRATVLATKHAIARDLIAPAPAAVAEVQ